MRGWPPSSLRFLRQHRLVREDDGRPYEENLQYCVQSGSQKPLCLWQRRSFDSHLAHRRGLTISCCLWRRRYQKQSHVARTRTRIHPRDSICSTVGLLGRHDQNVGHPLWQSHVDVDGSCFGRVWNNLAPETSFHFLFMLTRHLYTHIYHRWLHLITQAQLPSVDGKLRLGPVNSADRHSRECFRCKRCVQAL